MRAFIGGLVLILAGCSGAATPEEAEAARARAVAEVEANQEAPPEMVVPQPILYPDIEKHGLFGAGCNFVPEGGGLGAVVLAQASSAVIKRDGEIMRLAADKGSSQNPLGSWRKYDGKEVALEIDIATDQGVDVGSESTNYPAMVMLKDGKDRVVYRSSGMAQCGS